MRTRTEVTIVDLDGDPIDPELFKPHVTIPTEIMDVSVSFDEDKNATVKYLLMYRHDK